MWAEDSIRVRMIGADGLHSVGGLLMRGSSAGTTHSGELTEFKAKRGPAVSQATPSDYGRFGPFCLHC